MTPIEAVSTYFYSVLVERKPKTNVYQLKSKHWGDVIGLVKWYAPWRQYCFFPDSETVWSRSCLNDVNNFIQELMSARKMNGRVSER